MKKYSLAILIWIVFEAVAKIFGPLIFGRGFCGYACWTAMVLDFLPYKTSVLPRENIGWIRYLTFALSFLFVSALFLLKVGNLERIMFWTFLIGNLAYYLVGIALAFFSRTIGLSANISARLPYSLSQ